MKYFFTVMYFFFSLLNSADIEESKTSGIKLFIEGSGLDLTIIPCILKHKFFGNNKFNFKEIPEDELPNKIKIKLTESFLHFIQVYLNMQEFRLLFSTKDNLPTEEKIKFIEDYSKKLNFFAIKGLFTTYILISIKNSPYCYFSWSNGEECGSIFDGPKKESGIALYQLLTQNNISNIDTVWGFSNGGVVLGYLLEAIKKNKSKLKVEYAYLLETPLFRKVEEN